MKKTTALVIALLIMSGGAMALPKVWLDPACAKVTAIDTDAGSLIGLIGGFFNPPATYATVDLNNDDVPDAYQLALLGEALCAPGTGYLNGQYDINLATYDTLVTKLSDAINIALGLPAGTRDALGTRLGNLATILTNLIATNPGGALTPEQITALTVVRDQLADLSTTINDLLGEVEPYKNLIPVVLAQFPGWRELGAGLVGLDGYVLQELMGLLNQYMGDITLYLGYGQAAISAFQNVLPLLSTTDQAYVNAAITDTNSILASVDWIMNTLPNSVEVFGVVKAAGEPFSGAADYDGDGLTNLQVYEGITAAGGGKAEFVAAASGYNPFFAGNPNLPVAGIFGLAMLAGAMGLGGALSIRKK